MEGIKQEVKHQIAESNNMYELRMADMEEAQYEDNGKVLEILEKQETSDYRMAFLTDVVSRQESEIKSLKQRITELERSNMGSNTVFTGIPESKDENCVMESQNFFGSKMRLWQDMPIKSARRFGCYSNNRRAMLIEFSDPKKKGMVFRNMANLKEEQNAEGTKFFVNDHLPDELNEKRRKYKALIAIFLHFSCIIIQIVRMIIRS